jgi:hypothetical protein
VLVLDDRWYENVRSAKTSAFRARISRCSSIQTSERNSAALQHHVRHGFHEDIGAGSGRHIPIEQTVNTAGRATPSMQCAPPSHHVSTSC